jgi:hypothetical protein
MAKPPVTMPGKRLVLLLDGTWNSSEDNTSVWRLSQLVASKDAADTQQLCYYTAGVGTPRGERIRGGMLGYGLDRDIIGAYRWLMGHYDQGDQIFLFGFSRGAFTARSIAGMIARCGLLRPGSPLSVEELYERYRLDARAPSFVELHQTKNLPAEEKRLLRHSRRVPIKMIGVWDTVGALGIPFGNIPGLSRRRFGFHNSRLSAIYEHAYHALALDEHRAAFAPTLWQRFTPTEPDPPGKRRVRPTIVEQRWFAGAHANVGGGIAGDDMPQLPLAWLMEKAGRLGLAWRGEVVPTGYEVDAPIHDSFKGFLGGLYPIVKLGRRFHRRVAAPATPAARGSWLSVGEVIDGSVFDRWRKTAAYRPRDLVRWAKELDVDPAKLHGAVDARTGAALAPPAPPKPRVKRVRGPTT